MSKSEKLYVYVDESGQDAASRFFVVVAVIGRENQGHFRQQLEHIEHSSGTGRKKWHKLRRENRMRYLSFVIGQKVAAGDIFVASYKKPIPFFFPMVFLLDKAIKSVAKKPYRARIFVDGIDKQKAKELTNALRASGISLDGVRGKRDESEPCIRLADMWAGCMRSALLHEEEAKNLIKRAKKENYLRDLT
jgi:hypothetical protein